MSDWLIILLILLAIPLILAILLAIIFFIDYVQWKLKEKKNDDNELQASSEDDIPWYTKISNNNEFVLAKYEREGMTLKVYKEKYWPIFLKGIKDPSIGELTRDELDKIMRDTNTMIGQFEDWYIPEQQKDE